MPIVTIFFNFYSSYRGGGKPAKESFMIVRFWGYDRKLFLGKYLIETGRLCGEQSEATGWIVTKQSRNNPLVGMLTHSLIPILTVARLLRRRPAHFSEGLLAMTRFH
ncbi:MAG: hypothetical protein JNM41_13905 [Flavipsychrobacter sp.]|nr:hypothetical protein [Flavipsychrobacter sp.]